MTGNLDAFCERCGKTAMPAASSGVSTGKVLRRLGLGGRSSRDAADSGALRLCLGCRGYICTECWNDEAAVCQTCQPLAGVGVSVPAEMAQEEVAPGFEIVDDAPPQPAADMAWPASDLFRAPEPVAADETFEAVDSHEPYEANDADQPAEKAADLSADEATELEPVATGAPAADDEETATESAEDTEVAEPAATADTFEDRWAEIMGRIQALGAPSTTEALSESAAALEPEVKPELSFEAPAPVVEEPAYAAQDWQPAPESTSEPTSEPVDEEPAYEVAEETGSLDEPGYEQTESPHEEPAEAAPPVVEAELVEVTMAESVDTDEAVDEAARAETAPEVRVADEPAAPEVVTEPAAEATTDPEEDLWAAVLHDAETVVEAEPAEPGRNELSSVHQPRRMRRRVARILPRRPVRPMPAQQPAAPMAASERPTPAAEPPADAPTFTFVEPAPEPGPPPLPRVLKLPPALPPPPPSMTQPWPMPTPPAYLPPPPPSVSNVQPAPARFRPQVVAVETPKPPATRPCDKCGLELSAKVAFCRRCGSRQPPAA